MYVFCYDLLCLYVFIKYNFVCKNNIEIIIFLIEAS